MKSSASFGIRQLVIYDFTSVHSSDVFAAISIARNDNPIKGQEVFGARSEGRLWGQISAYDFKYRICPQFAFFLQSSWPIPNSRIFASVS